MAQWRLFTKRDYAQLADGSDEEYSREIHSYPFLENYEHSKGGKLPRNHAERCYRLTSNQHVLASTVIRYLRMNNCLEVQSFLVEESRKLNSSAAARELLIFLLSEAFRCSGVLALQFASRNKRGISSAPIPTSVLAITETYGVPIENLETGFIPHEIGKRLYVELTGFTPAAREIAESLDSAGLASIERTCYLVHRGLWSRQEMETILLGCPYPELVLGIGADPFDRHLSQCALLHARSAVLGGMLDRALARRPHQAESGSIFNFEEDEIEIEMEFDPSINAKTYHTDSEPLALSWAINQEKNDLLAGSKLTVLIRPRRSPDISKYLADDFRVAETYGGKKKANRISILLPFDFNFLPKSEQDLYAERSKKSGVSLFVCPDGITQLTAEANRIMSSSKIIRL